jgi:predicted nucleotidyltransferase
MAASWETIRAAVAAEPEVRFALGFGSRARGDARPDSDWDVAVFVDPVTDAARRFELRNQLSAALAPAVGVDVTILNDAPPLLAHRALQGRLLLLRDREAYVRFYVRTLAEAGDQGYWSQLHARERRRRLAGGGFGRP